MATNRLWKFLTTPVGDLVSLDTIDKGKEIISATPGLARSLKTEGEQIQDIHLLAITDSY
ncbi:MAG: hypothetical protein AAF728_07340 [Cyanobacteria bacterium P01_D01_bin.128]